MRARDDMQDIPVEDTYFDLKVEAFGLGAALAFILGERRIENLVVAGDVATLASGDVSDRAQIPLAYGVREAALSLVERLPPLGGLHDDVTSGFAIKGHRSHTGLSAEIRREGIEDRWLVVATNDATRLAQAIALAQMQRIATHLSHEDGALTFFDCRSTTPPRDARPLPDAGSAQDVTRIVREWIDDPARAAANTGGHWLLVSGPPRGDPRLVVCIMPIDASRDGAPTPAEERDVVQPASHREIERKFLVCDEDALETLCSGAGDAIEQFYLSLDPQRAVRVRLTRHADGRESAKLTIKGERTAGVCLEVETAITPDEARALAPLALGHVLRKTRWRVPLEDGLVAEIDRYSAPHPLLLVEVELPAQDAPFDPPAWFGQDVTEDLAYHALTIARSGA